MWKQLAIITELEDNYYYERALQKAIRLVKYLPSDFQDPKKLNFPAKAKSVLEELNKVIIDNAMSHRRNINTRQAKNQIASNLLDEFIQELCITLDKKGYMEQKGGLTPRGHE